MKEENKGRRDRRINVKEREKEEPCDKLEEATGEIVERSG